MSVLKEICEELNPDFPYDDFEDSEKDEIFYFSVLKGFIGGLYDSINAHCLLIERLRQELGISQEKLQEIAGNL